MFGKPTIDASSTITLKRKRAPVWPFSTRPVLEQAIAIMVERGTLYELSPLMDGESTHLPRQEILDFSTNVGFGAQTTKTSGSSSRSDNQHSQDPTRTTARTGFEEGQVFTLNSDLSQLLRSLVRGGGGH